MRQPRARRPPTGTDGGRRRPRWWAIGILAAAIVAVLAAIVAWPRRAQADLHPIARQNVLLITIDTLRADALSSYGGAAATAALDRLADEGVRFDFPHAHAVVTLTSHA